MTPLNRVKQGDKARVAQVQGGRGFVQRLAEMGVYPGTTLTIIRGGGPVIVDVKGHRLVLGRGMAHRVLVTPLVDGA